MARAPQSVDSKLAVAPASDDAGQPALRVFTPEELAQYDGSDPNKPVYLAILGKVYDVTAGRSYYGKGGSYSFFSGKDATRAYITGCFDKDLTHDLRGLTDLEIKTLSTWTDFYEKHKKYFVVGRVNNPPIDPNSPIPEPCGG
ncbi:cytochrome b5-like heme/steroid binding domain-containing protein [Entophlyctis helioformis]|nr:cytochrome b5-like heme/steroid binding domain-containing protein [Entophlyctis helioformis]